MSVYINAGERVSNPKDYAGAVNYHIKSYVEYQKLIYVETIYCLTHIYVRLEYEGNDYCFSIKNATKNLSEAFDELDNFIEGKASNTIKDCIIIMMMKMNKPIW